MQLEQVRMQLEQAPGNLTLPLYLSRARRMLETPRHGRSHLRCWHQALGYLLQLKKILR